MKLFVLQEALGTPAKIDLNKKNIYPYYYLLNMNKLFYALITVFIVSCSTAKKLPTVPPVVKDTASIVEKAETPAMVIENLNHIDFKTFSGKADVDFDDGKGGSRSVSAKLIMKKDEVIWLSAGLMGFEGIRVMITKDSVKVLNKLQKEYTASSLAYLQEKIGLPLDFAMLQDLLIGNAVFVNKESATMEKEATKYNLTTEDKKFKNLLTVLISGYLLSESRLSDLDPAQKRSATLLYNDYRSVSGRNFSALRDIKVNYKTNISIKLNYRSADFDGEVTTPFSIPTGYTTK